MRWLLLLLLFLIPLPARAAPCPPPVSFYDGFSGQFFSSPSSVLKTTGFLYGLDEETLYVFFYNGAITGFYPVYLSTAQNFNYAANPDTFYSQQILPFFTEAYVCGYPPLG